MRPTYINTTVSGRQPDMNHLGDDKQRFPRNWRNFTLNTAARTPLPQSSYFSSWRFQCFWPYVFTMPSTVNLLGGRSPAPSVAPVPSGMACPVWLSNAMLHSLAGEQSYSSYKCLQMLSYNSLSKEYVGAWGSLTFYWSGSKGLYWQPNQFPSMV